MMWNTASFVVTILLVTGSVANPPVGALPPPLVAPLNIPDKVNTIPPPHEDLLAIQRTMSLYPFLVDGKAWDQLDRIFHPDIWANYSGYIGVVHTIPEVKTALSQIMAPVTSQHALSSQLIEVSPNGTTADSWTYYWANHFGTGEYFGQALWTWGTYQDYWVKNSTTGEWRILGRQNAVTGPFFGNTSVLPV